MSASLAHTTILQDGPAPLLCHAILALYLGHLTELSQYGYGADIIPNFQRSKLRGRGADDLSKVTQLVSGRCRMKKARSCWLRGPGPRGCVSRESGPCTLYSGLLVLLRGTPLS